MTRCFVSVTFLLLSTAGAQAVPVPWPIGSGGNGHSYEAVLEPEGITWTAANAAAIAAGGHLATITSAEENTFVFDLIDNDSFWFAESPPDSNSGIGPWLGGFQPAGSAEPAGGWSWVTGEPFTYTNWDPLTPGGEPNNTSFAGGPEDALQFFSHQSRGTLRNPTWNDYPSSALIRGYIIEFDDAVAVPEPSAIVLIACGLLPIGASAWLRRVRTRAAKTHAH